MIDPCSDEMGLTLNILFVDTNCETLTTLPAHVVWHAT